jgi:antimicrobial peptide system SdpB family protein
VTPTAILGSARERALLRAAARSLLGIAHASTLLSTSDSVLFARLSGQQPAAGCTGVRGLSLWCAAGTSGLSGDITRAAAVGVLAAVVAGYRPRWTCIPHWYVAFSLTASISVPNGGEYAAQAATLLLVPICLGDRRTWQWSREEAMDPAWRGAARAAHLAVRLQLVVVYVWAVVAKLAAPAWRQGSALRGIFLDPIFGWPPAVQDFLSSLLASGPVIAAMTWSVLAVELAIALSMFGGPRFRRCGLVLAVGLHATIAVTLGLFSFGIIMIGFVLLSGADISSATPVSQPRGKEEVGWTRLSSRSTSPRPATGTSRTTTT